MKNIAYGFLIGGQVILACYQEVFIKRVWPFMNLTKG